MCTKCASGWREPVRGPVPAASRRVSVQKKDGLYPARGWRFSAACSRGSSRGRTRRQETCTRPTPSGRLPNGPAAFKILPCCGGNGGKVPTSNGLSLYFVPVARTACPPEGGKGQKGGRENFTARGRRGGIFFTVGGGKMGKGSWAWALSMMNPQEVVPPAKAGVQCFVTG